MLGLSETEWKLFRICQNFKKNMPLPTMLTPATLPKAQSCGLRWNNVAAVENPAKKTVNTATVANADIRHPPSSQVFISFVTRSG
jgi:hypothetical protein